MFWILDKLKMDFINSSLFNTTEVYFLFLTLKTMEVAIIYLLNGKLGRSLGNLQQTSWQMSKNCGKFKARLVAYGHLVKEPTETVYSGVVSLRNLILAMLLAELNNLQLWRADIGNAYLQALIKEKLYNVVTQNLVSYKDMFLLCTRHSMYKIWRSMLA